MIKVAIVGTGCIAEWHASAFKNDKNSDVIAACDVNNDRLNEFCNKFGINKRYNNVDELLDNEDIDAATKGLITALKQRSDPVVLVTNEVGSSIVPENALARRFRDEAGLMNQTISQIADEVYVSISGIPLQIKPNLNI